MPPGKAYIFQVFECTNGEILGNADDGLHGAAGALSESWVMKCGGSVDAANLSYWLEVRDQNPKSKFAEPAGLNVPNGHDHCVGGTFRTMRKRKKITEAADDMVEMTRLDGEIISSDGTMETRAPTVPDELFSASRMLEVTEMVSMKIFRQVAAARWLIEQARSKAGLLPQAKQFLMAEMQNAPRETTRVTKSLYPLLKMSKASQFARAKTRDESLCRRVHFCLSQGAQPLCARALPGDMGTFLLST
ncbi:hypothetical protein BJ741DRAFT_654662 [Chytriomyces cf. hyalinus JEL632]|nr:hypothetical protein BJ741DRAFT_654662 [Chytriomyces cf. hyalinus JEL632]